MFVPTYVAKKVGDEYVIVRVDPTGTMLRTATAAAGVGLLGYAAARRGLWAALLASGGAALAYHGWTGRNLLSRLFSGDGPRHGDRSQTPSHPADDREQHQAVQVPADRVEEELMES